MHVYHASSTQGLRVIEPRAGTHGTWVYATKDAGMASLFISGVGGDFTCQIGRDPATDRPYVCERFKGAFEHRYLARQGSIYVLPGGSFLSGMTPWPEEVVSADSVRVIEETVVDDASTYLWELAGRGEIIICRYPERIDDIPPDDQDLVEKAVLWAKRHGLTVLDRFAEYHPQLVDRVRQALEHQGSTSWRV